MAKEKEIIVPAQNSPEAMITLAIEKGADITVLERMFVMREKFLAEQAKSAYLKALSAFQEAVPVIEKNKPVLNRDGRTVRYKFATVDSIIKQIQKPLSKAEISYRWEVKQDGGAVTATCITTHVLGHSEQSSFTVSVDPEGFMTAPQKAASALTFAKRYSLLNALGITTGDEDTDATDVGKEKSPLSDKSKIIFLLRSLGKPTKTAADVAKSVKDTVHFELTEKNYPQIIQHLELDVRKKNADEATIE